MKIGLATLVLVAAGAGAMRPSLHFAAPAQAGSSLDAAQGTWALIVSTGGTEFSYDLENASGLIRRQHTITEAMFYPVHEEGTARTPLPSRIRLAAQTAGFSSVYVEGDIQIGLKGATATIEIPPKNCLGSMVPLSMDMETRAWMLCPAEWPAIVVHPVVGSGLNFGIEANNVSRVQWHNVRTFCSTEKCPPGGTQQNTTVTEDVHIRRHVFEDSFGFGANVTGLGEAELIIFGGTNLDLAVNGWVRLPLASGDAGCASCLAPADQTFSATGNITLSNLQVAPGGGLQGDLSGDLDSARFDEASIDPAALTGEVAFVAAAAAGGIALLVKFLLWPLFTRNRDDDLLANDRRRKLYDFVVKNPGVHFREVLRATGIPAGSGRHHIERLVVAGLLTQRRQRSSLLLFENHKRFHDTWQDWAALRDPKLRQLHDWLVLHPNSKQKDILDAFRNLHGWTLTTTQRRLERLVRDGVAQARTQGRYKFYSATQASAELMVTGLAVKVAASA